MHNNRIWEIDLLRSFAIILMIVFHIDYDLNEFAGIDIKYESLSWYLVGKVSVFLFIFLSGISSGFSRNSIRRGMKVFLAGMLITAATYITFKDEYVRFGVLHFLGICMIAFPILKKINSWILIPVSFISLFLGYYFSHITLNTFLLVPLGIVYGSFKTIDYVPIFPYISVYIFGILCYRLIYREKRSLFSFDFDLKFLRSISKNSLLIYLIHQPIIIFTIFILNTFIKK